MAQPQTGSDSPGYYILVEDSSRQTTERVFFILEHTRDPSTQTPEGSLTLLDQPPVTSETSAESRKRKISNEQDSTHFPNVGKVPRTETSGTSDEIVSSSSEAGCGAPSHATFKSRFLVSSNTQFHYFENNSHSNSQNGFSAKQQAVQETERKQSRCFSCKKTISEHVAVHEGTTKYRCCRCLLPSENFNYLQSHIYNEHKPYFCKVCQLKHWGPNSHVHGGTCAACDLYFKCKYQLEEHYILIHKDFLKTNCKICRRKFDDHLTAGEVVEDKYQCCVRECKIRLNTTSDLDKHLCTHSPLKLSKCELCGDHFKKLQQHLESVHPVCKLCGKRFVNSYFLNEHRSEEHKEE